jgi:hypothetical protein
MQVVQLILKVRHRPCSRLRRRVRYTQIDSHAILVGPWLRKDERRTRPLSFSVLVHQAHLVEIVYLVTQNFSCGGAYLRADIRTGSAPSRSLMTRGLTFAGGSAPSLSLKTSLHSITNCRKLCTPSRDMPACSALVMIPSIASASSSGLPCPTSTSW